MHRDAFEQVLELNRAADFREDGERIWIPFDERRTHLHVIAFIDLELRAVHDRIALLLAAFLVHDGEHTVTIHRNEETWLVPDSLQIVELDCAGVLGFQTRLLGYAACRSADVEGTHRQLRSRLADRLICDHAHSLADFQEFGRCEISAIATAASPG